MPRDLNMPVDLVMAIGLVWGHLSARQFEEAFLLAKGCLCVWPDERNLTLMQSYAVAEVLEPVKVGKPFAINDAACKLGYTLTVDNPVWRGDPIPGMRALLKKLTEATLQLADSDRAALLVAIELVEKAVQMRLRLQQMLKSEAEASTGQTNEKQTGEEMT